MNETGDLWLWIVNGLIAAGLALLGIMLGLVGSVVGFVVHRIHNNVDKLSESHDQNCTRISAVEVKLSREHPTRTDFDRLEDKMQKGLKASKKP